MGRRGRKTGTHDSGKNYLMLSNYLENQICLRECMYLKKQLDISQVHSGNGSRLTECSKQRQLEEIIMIYYQCIIT